nr:hypothetical protein CFP56_09129 [Quercus suber]
MDQASRRKARRLCPILPVPKVLPILVPTTNWSGPAEEDQRTSHSSCEETDEAGNVHTLSRLAPPRWKPSLKRGKKILNAFDFAGEKNKVFVHD